MQDNTNLRRSLADGTATDVGLHSNSLDGVHHGSHLLFSGQPVAVVAPGGHSAPVVDAAEHEGHGVEALQTTAW